MANLKNTRRPKPMTGKSGSTPNRTFKKGGKIKKGK